MEQFERDMTTTWRLLVPVTVVLLTSCGEALACSILEQRPLDDMDGGISGYCSNNGQAITCRATPGEGWTCESLQGAYTSVNTLQTLVDQACGCSVTDTEE
ncbi:MAG: hypothetical protein H6972_03230 [Gammaproteobacteria bacterium]|nr:hypothetical protein [Gammaproteobacteria bacterium]